MDNGEVFRANTQGSDDRVFTLLRKGRHWEVRDPSGNLICVTVYKCGALEVIRRLDGVYQVARSDSLEASAGRQVWDGFDLPLPKVRCESNHDPNAFTYRAVSKRRVEERFPKRRGVR